MRSKKIVIVLSALISMIFLLYAATAVHYIDQEACTKCGVCIEECPEEAIVVVEKDGEEVHMIDQEKCIQCGVCIEACPEEAILVGDPENAEIKKKGKKKK
jgi:ferredoxin